MTIDIENKLHNDIKEYCRMNGLVMKDFVNKLLKKSFTVEKYGETPFGEVSLKPKIHNTEVVEKKLQFEDEPKTIFNGDCDIERYKGEVPKNYYEEIKVTHKQTEKKSKKRKL